MRATLIDSASLTITVSLEQNRCLVVCASLRAAQHWRLECRTQVLRRVNSKLRDVRSKSEDELRQLLQHVDELRRKARLLQQTSQRNLNVNFVERNKQNVKRTSARRSYSHSAVGNAQIQSSRQLLRQIDQKLETRQEAVKRRSLSPPYRQKLAPKPTPQPRSQPSTANIANSGRDAVAHKQKAQILEELISRYLAVLFLRAARREVKVTHAREQILDASLPQFQQRTAFKAFYEHASRRREIWEAVDAMHRTRTLSRILKKWHHWGSTRGHKRRNQLKAQNRFAATIRSKYFALLHINVLQRKSERCAFNVADLWRYARQQKQMFERWMSTLLYRQKIKRAMCGTTSSVPFSRYIIQHAKVRAKHDTIYSALHGAQQELGNLRDCLQVKTSGYQKRAKARRSGPVSDLAVVIRRVHPADRLPASLLDADSSDTDCSAPDSPTLPLDNFGPMPHIVPMPCTSVHPSVAPSVQDGLFPTVGHTKRFGVRPTKAVSFMDPEAVALGTPPRPTEVKIPSPTLASLELTGFVQVCDQAFGLRCGIYGQQLDFGGDEEVQAAPSPHPLLPFDDDGPARARPKQGAASRSRSISPPVVPYSVTTVDYFSDDSRHSSPMPRAGEDQDAFEDTAPISPNFMAPVQMILSETAATISRLAAKCTDLSDEADPGHQRRAATETAGDRALQGSDPGTTYRECVADLAATTASTRPISVGAQCSAAAPALYRRRGTRDSQWLRGSASGKAQPQGRCSADSRLDTRAHGTAAAVADLQSQSQTQPHPSTNVFAPASAVSPVATADDFAISAPETAAVRQLVQDIRVLHTCAADDPRLSPGLATAMDAYRGQSLAEMADTYYRLRRTSAMWQWWGFRLAEARRTTLVETWRRYRTLGRGLHALRQYACQWRINAATAQAWAEQRTTHAALSVWHWAFCIRKLRVAFNRWRFRLHSRTLAHRAAEDADVADQLHCQRLQAAHFREWVAAWQHQRWMTSATEAAADMYARALLRRAVGPWHQRARRRRLMRKLFGLAASRWRLLLIKEQEVDNPQLMRYVLKVWHRWVLVSNSRRNNLAILHRTITLMRGAWAKWLQRKEIAHRASVFLSNRVHRRLLCDAYQTWVEAVRRQQALLGCVSDWHLQQRCVAQWKWALGIAQYGNAVKLRRMFKAWSAYTDKHVRKKPGRAFRQLYRRRYFGAWIRQCNVRKRAAMADRFQRERLLRFGLYKLRHNALAAQIHERACHALAARVNRRVVQDCFALWIIRHRYALHWRNAFDMAARAYRHRQFAKAWCGWQRYVLRQQTKRLNVLRADIFFKSTYLYPTKAPAAHVLHTQSAHTETHGDDRARLVLRYRRLIRYFGLWKSYTHALKSHRRQPPTMSTVVRRCIVGRFFRRWRGAYQQRLRSREWRIAGPFPYVPTAALASPADTLGPQPAPGSSKTSPGHCSMARTPDTAATSRVTPTRVAAAEAAPTASSCAQTTETLAAGKARDSQCQDWAKQSVPAACVGGHPKAAEVRPDLPGQVPGRLPLTRSAVEELQDVRQHRSERILNWQVACQDGNPDVCYALPADRRVSTSPTTLTTVSPPSDVRAPKAVSMNLTPTIVDLA